MDDAESACGAPTSFGEMFVTFGRSNAGPGAEVCWPDAAGARIDVVAFNPFSGSHARLHAVKITM